MHARSHPLLLLQILIHMEMALPQLRARLLPDGKTSDHAAKAGVIAVKLCICNVITSVLDNWREAVSQMVFSAFVGVISTRAGVISDPAGVAKAGWNTRGKVGAKPNFLGQAGATLVI